MSFPNRGRGKRNTHRYKVVVFKFEKGNHTFSALQVFDGYDGASRITQTGRIGPRRTVLFVYVCVCMYSENDRASTYNKNIFRSTVWP